MIEIMIVHVVVKPSSKAGPYIQMGLDGSLLVCVKEPALAGKANKAVILELAKHYKVPKSYIILRSGASSRHKTFKITGG
jgi:uncharacterized protein